MSDQTRPPDDSEERAPTHPDFAAPNAGSGDRAGYARDRTDPSVTRYAGQPSYQAPVGAPPVGQPERGRQGQSGAGGQVAAIGRPATYRAGPDQSDGQSPQRPAMITLSLVLIVTGSLVWMAALGFVWIFVYIARDSFSYSGVEGAIYHLLEGFHLRMLQGLAFVLFGAPTAAVVLSFFLLRRARWPRIAISAVGAAGLAVCGVMLAGDLNWMIPGAAYIAFACVILWTPAVTRWCTWADADARIDQRPVQTSAPGRNRSW